jgi:hypothetical protein
MPHAPGKVKWRMSKAESMSQSRPNQSATKHASFFFQRTDLENDM